MSILTRDVLVKIIVAEEIRGVGGNDYIKKLNELKRKWEHTSSEELCHRVNQIESSHITVDMLQS